MANPNQIIEELEASLATMDIYTRHCKLHNIIQAAFAQQDFAKAAAYANELLQGAEEHGRAKWNYGNAIHYGNVMLGRIALVTMEAPQSIEEAKAHLMAAGQTPGSPQLNSFGPNMGLARDLLECGERTAVLTYFESCGNFWNMNLGKLEAWKAVVEEGGIPEFGPNLRYAS